jgi:hypothetical protein
MASPSGVILGNQFLNEADILHIQLAVAIGKKGFVHSDLLVEDRYNKKSPVSPAFSLIMSFFLSKG